MNIVVLYSGSQKNYFYLDELIKFLKSYKDDKIYLLRNKPITKSFISKKKINFLISFHNKFILNKTIIKALKNNCINFHSSLLPTCKGMDPIIFSAATKKSFGLTIHLINNKLDDGEYIYQKKINLNKFNTLKQAHKKHEEESIRGFKQIYPEIKKKILKNENIQIRKYSRKNVSSFFWASQSLKIRNLLPKLWDTKIFEVRKIFLKNKERILAK